MIAWPCFDACGEVVLLFPAISEEIARLEHESADSRTLFGLLPLSKRLDATRTTLFLGNLPYAATVESLRKHHPAW